MEVIATKLGFYGSLRRAGEKFEVSEGTKGSWFEPTAAAASEPAPVKTRARAKKGETPLPTETEATGDEAGGDGELTD
jgi:hypothetical protein